MPFGPGLSCSAPSRGGPGLGPAGRRSLSRAPLAAAGRLPARAPTPSPRRPTAGRSQRVHRDEPELAAVDGTRQRGVHPPLIHCPSSLHAPCRATRRFRATRSHHRIPPAPFNRTSTRRIVRPRPFRCRAHTLVPEVGAGDPCTPVGAPARDRPARHRRPRRPCGPPSFRCLPPRSPSRPQPTGVCAPPRLASSSSASARTSGRHFAGVSRPTPRLNCSANCLGQACSGTSFGGS